MQVRRVPVSVANLTREHTQSQTSTRTHPPTPALPLISGPFILRPPTSQVWSSFVWILGSVLLTASAFSHSMSKELRVGLGAAGIVLAALGSGAQSPTQSKVLGGEPQIPRASESCERTPVQRARAGL